MRAKLVSEGIGDILKPKTVDDIKKDHRALIYWKNIIEGKRSPDSLKFFLDKDFIKKRAKELGIEKTPTKQWEKQLVYFLDRLEKFPLDTNDEIIINLRSKVGSHDHYGDTKIHAPAALYINIKSFIEGEFKRLDREVKRRMGKGLKD